MNKKTSKKWYKKIWVWLIISVSIIIIVFGVPLAINYFYTKDEITKILTESI